MAPIVGNALREWKLACPKGRLNLVFPTGTGSVQSHANVAGRGWEPLQRAAGLVDERNRPRYRLTLATPFLRILGHWNGVCAKAIADIAGAQLDPDDLRSLRPLARQSR
jgi:hypothetical protein